MSDFRDVAVLAPDGIAMAAVLFGDVHEDTEA